VRLKDDTTADLRSRVRAYERGSLAEFKKWVVRNKGMAAGVAGYRSLARSSVNQALSAVMLAHHTAGYSLDRKHPLIAETWRGISRSKARTSTSRWTCTIPIRRNGI
jgi:hypothetical protein